jgi:predicted DNA-binding transcriptional regulator AlpA
MDEMLRERDVCALRKCGRTKLWDDVRKGLFPPPVFDGPRSKRWFRGEITAHQEALKTKRDNT